MGDRGAVGLRHRPRASGIDPLRQALDGWRRRLIEGVRPWRGRGSRSRACAGEGGDLQAAGLGGAAGGHHCAALSQTKDGGRRRSRSLIAPKKSRARKGSSVTRRPPSCRVVGGRLLGRVRWISAPRLAAATRGPAEGQRGWKWHPGGGASGDGISPVIGRNTPRPAPIFGTLSKQRLRVADAPAPRRACGSAPSSTMRPRYMIATRSETWRTTPRSWLTKMAVRSRSRRRSWKQVQDLRLDRDVEPRPPARRATSSSASFADVRGGDGDASWSLAVCELVGKGPARGGVKPKAPACFRRRRLGVPCRDYYVAPPAPRPPCRRIRTPGLEAREGVLVDHLRRGLVIFSTSPPGARRHRTRPS